MRKNDHVQYQIKEVRLMLQILHTRRNFSFDDVKEAVHFADGITSVYKAGKRH